jgi:hypothetical protein
MSSFALAVCSSRRQSTIKYWPSVFCTHTHYAGGPITVSMSVDLGQGSERKPSMAISERPGNPGQLYITSKQSHSDQEADGMPPVHGSLSKSNEQANNCR